MALFQIVTLGKLVDLEKELEKMRIEKGSVRYGEAARLDACKSAPSARLRERIRAHFTLLIYLLKP